MSQNENQGSDGQRQQQQSPEHQGNSQSQQEQSQHSQQSQQSQQESRSQSQSQQESQSTPQVATFTFAVTGNQTVQVDRVSANELPKQFVQFNPTGGDVLNLADVLNGTAATLATLGNYITATTSAAGDTTLSFDATGTGLAGTAFAVLKGVSITVAQLLADNALSVGTAAPLTSLSTPHVDTITFAATGNQTAQVDGISVAQGPELFVQFNPTGGDVLNLANVIKGSTATLATLGNYITATTSAAGDTTLSFDATGTGLAGTAFAVLKGVSITVPQLLADNALSVGAAVAPVLPVVPVVPHVDTVTFAATGNQTAVVDGISATQGPEQFLQFNPTGGNVLNLTNVVKGTAATLATLGGYITAATSAAGDTTLSFDATGTGLAGTAFALLKGVTITMPQLLADNAFAINTPVTLGSATHVTLVENNAVLTYGRGNYDISVTGTGENVSVGNGNSQIFGSEGASTVVTGNGHQEILLTGTNNAITVGDNNTTGVTEIFAGTGNDHVTAGAGSVYIVGSGHGDTITVGNGNDTIVETAGGSATIGINLITLGSGNDAVFLGGSGNTVVLGSGTDRVVGGTGSDTFVVNAAGGADTISNFSLTNGDKIDLTKILSTTTLQHDLSNLGSFVTLTSVVDTATSTGLDTKLTITGGGGSAGITLVNSGPMGLTDLVSHGSLVLPPH